MRINNAADDEPPLPDEDMQALVDKVFAGELKAGMIDTPTALRTANDFMKGVFDGFGGNFATIDYATPDYALLQSIEQNVFAFSGAKNYQMLKELNLLLKDGDRLRTKSEYKREAYKLVDEWNGRWKDTEYNTAVNGSIATRDWARYEAEKHLLPMLTFRAVKDGRTCPICQPYDKLTAPVDSPVWNYASPLLHFGDRCKLLQTVDGIATPENMWPTSELVPKMFRTNMAKEGLVFPPDHPFFERTPQRPLNKFLKDNLPDREQ